MTAKSCVLGLMAALILALQAPAEEVRGVIIKADAGKKELILEGRGKGARGRSMTFLVDKDTQILIGKQPGQMADLVAGKRARVTYEFQGGRRVATLIMLHGAAPAASEIMPVPKDANAVSGVLRRVALTDREIVVISPAAQGKTEKETTLAVPENAKITKDQKAIRFDDLKEGQQVVVHPEKQGGKLVAKSIEVGAASKTNMPGAGGGPRTEKLRQILKMIDAYLEQAAQKQSP